MQRSRHGILIVALIMTHGFLALVASAVAPDRPCAEAVRQFCKDVDAGQRHLLDPFRENEY